MLIECKGKLYPGVVYRHGHFHKSLSLTQGYKAGLKSGTNLNLFSGHFSSPCICPHTLCHHPLKKHKHICFPRSPMVSIVRPLNCCSEWHIWAPGHMIHNRQSSIETGSERWPVTWVRATWWQQYVVFWAGYFIFFQFLTHFVKALCHSSCFIYIQMYHIL